MKIYEIQNRTPQLIEKLLDVWEASVRATHLFLSDAEVKSIKEYVPQALENVEHLIVAEAEKLAAFMGTQNGRLEMLFIAPEEREKGIGKQLLQYGVQNHGITETSVYKGYKQDKIEMRGDRAEISDFPLYLNTVAGGLDCRDQTIGGFSFVVKIYAVPVIEIIE